MKKLVGTLFAVLVCAFGLDSAAGAQALSASKLSAHLINSYSPGSSNIVAGGPRVLKVLGLDSGFPSGMLQAMRDYKGKFPGGVVVVRVYSPKNYSLADDATAAASDFWINILQRGLNYLSASDRALIDYLEGPNEGQTPTLGYPGTAPLQASQWFNQFWTNLTPRIVGAGYKPCIGSLAVGNPGGSTAQMQSYLAAFVPALRQAQAAGGGWSYHAYTINYTTDPAVEIYYSLRYRQFYSYFASAFPDLSTLPLILTEGGVDFSGDPSTSGWQARGSAGDFQRWLNWFDRQVQADSYLLGCTLFENGDPAGWSSFELEPIGAWMKSYLAGPTAVPPAPSGVVARGGSGSVTLLWTNVPLSPTTWTVKRSNINGGPYATLASNLSSGVQATTYTDTAVASGSTYYYVVSAVNALGESANSAQVSAQPTNGLPDVVVSAVSWTPTTVFSGSQVVFSARVLNQGTAPTPAGVILGVGFNIDGAGTVSWSGGYTTPLQPNASVLLTADGGPAGPNYWVATPGAHTVYANVDDINRFPESNEANNILTAPINVFAAGYALNSGGAAVGAFAADANYSGTSTTASVANVIDLTSAANPAPAAVYQTERAGEFTYTLNYLPPGSNYTVRLHFAEISSSVTAAGQRRFNVLVNGVQALTDFDVFAAAGGQFKAVTRDIKIRADNSGTLTVRFSSGTAGLPKCSGIQLFSSPPANPPAGLTGATVTDGTFNLTWQTSPGGVYQVQYKDDLNLAAWTALSQPVLAGGNTLSVNAGATTGNRFYRVALIY